jgi:hypothetical protein
MVSLSFIGYEASTTLLPARDVRNARSRAGCGAGARPKCDNRASLENDKSTIIYAALIEARPSVTE